MEQSVERKGSDKLRRGVMVLIYLAVLTGIEYAVAVLEWPALILIVIAILKAAAVLWYFMHVGKVFKSASSEEHE